MTPERRDHLRRAATGADTSFRGAPPGVFRPTEAGAWIVVTNDSGQIVLAEAIELALSELERNEA